MSTGSEAIWSPRVQHQQPGVQQQAPEEASAMIHAALRRQSNKPQGGHMWPNRPPLLLCQQVFMHVADPKARWPQCLAVREGDWWWCH